jgi:predicted hydrocarbon binding protein
MAYPTDLAQQQLVTLPRASLAVLRAALLRDAGPGYASYLQEAGFAAGETLFTAFEAWLASRDAGPVSALALSDFGAQLADFFVDSGWGTLRLAPHGDLVVRIDASDWAESDPSVALEQPGCHWSAGMFADLLGRVAGGALAAFEVGCRSSGSSRCEWLVGSPEVLTFVYEQLQEGRSVDEALAALA